ncbi:pseudaminic acid cytidylyltransferase [Agarivorans sp. Toyoura001]|uniref:pseudaminic acid cytidylyltransferase n=1 Tax=Agarivorans sp. Toyoura001 TaxID=2283141 RepID=UPI0010D4F5B5|nr:pseudaminic acid cytidylyltransferase [Agarivorans sp. Toyoura001]GDY27927.1 pseudaminic acid cytidylyltransferase [Agarivorans sp. Toyoura001]
MSTVAIIPARGGSKRIPRKNIKLFNGKPIIAYSIESALQSQCFDRVIVSTDDTEIASIAKQYGAEVPFIRPANISNDYATTLDVIHHAVATLSTEQQFRDVCCIYATAPFITPSQLLEGKKLFADKNADYLFPVAEYPSAVQRSLLREKSGFLTMAYPEYLNSRSQDLQTAFYDTGQFYWGKASAFLNRTPIYSDKSVGLPVEKNSCVDIDDLQDWALAEFLYKYRQQL